MGIRPNRSRNNHQKKEEMIAITIIICITILLIVAMICYKEYKLSNGSDLSRIETELKLLRSEFETNDRILDNLAESISYLPKESQSKRILE